MANPTNHSTPTREGGAALPLLAFLAHLERGEIPPAPPIGASVTGYGRIDENWLDQHEARDAATDRGMWAIVDRIWTRQLADWIAGRRVLEIMAGAGWLARALADYSVSITATDSGDWDERHDKMRRVYPVEKLSAVDAIATYPDADILLVSWPPYGSGDIVDAAHAWSPRRPIVYIGESEGGCNPPDEFFDGFCYDETAPEFDLMSWDGIHDNVHVGYWK